MRRLHWLPQLHHRNRQQSRRKPCLRCGQVRELLPLSRLNRIRRGHPAQRALPEGVSPGAAAAGAYRRVLLDWHSRHAKVPSRLLAFCGPSFSDADTTCHSRYSHLAFTSLTTLVSMSNCKIKRKKDNARSDTSASGASRGVIWTSVGNPPRCPPCPRSSYAASAGTHGAATQYQREAAVSQQQQRHQQRFSGSW